MYLFLSCIWTKVSDIKMIPSRKVTFTWKLLLQMSKQNQVQPNILQGKSLLWWVTPTWPSRCLAAPLSAHTHFFSLCHSARVTLARLNYAVQVLNPLRGRLRRCHLGTLLKYFDIHSAVYVSHFHHVCCCCCCVSVRDIYSYCTHGCIWGKEGLFSKIVYK